MKTFAAPEPVAIGMSRLTSTSIGVDKGLVYDQDAGYYVLMSSEIAKIKVLKSKPLGLRKLLAIGLMATAALALLGGMLFTLMGGGGYLRNATTTLTASTATPVQSLPTAVASAPAAAQQPQPSAPVSPTVVAAAVQVPKASEPSAAVAIVPTVVSPRPVAAVVAVATSTAPKVAPPVKIAAQAAPKPVKATPKPTAKTTPAKLASKAPEGVASSAIAPGKGWALRVESQGVVFFDGTASKLFRVGDTLPTGERVIDVDEGSATYATDKGVRQIRSVQMKGN